MLDTAPILWLQKWTSPALGELMRAVSVCGYVPSCLAAAIACGFGWRLKLGVTLILAIVFADSMATVAKGAFASPRPHAVDIRLLTLGTFESRLPMMATNSTVPADDFGFPSGHVATTTAWTLGLAWSGRKAWKLAAAGIWIALMALSRMYLGRHFPVDVLGGVVAGAAGLAMARMALPSVAADVTRLSGAASRALAASILVAVAFAAYSGDASVAHTAGRFCGLVGATLLLAGTGALDEYVPPGTRAARAAVALVLLGVALWSSTWSISTIPSFPLAGMLAVSAALHASVLLVPAFLLRRSQP